jgi:selenocysteine-specific translation elongation factor
MAKSREITIPDNSYIEFSVLYVELLEIVKSMGYEKIIIVIENLDRLRPMPESVFKSPIVAQLILLNNYAAAAA